jgi:hypothetical protein
MNPKNDAGVCSQVHCSDNPLIRLTQSGQMEKSSARSVSSILADARVGIRFEIGIDQYFACQRMLRLDYQRREWYLASDGIGVIRLFWQDESVESASFVRVLSEQDKEELRALLTPHEY